MCILYVSLFLVPFGSGFQKLNFIKIQTYPTLTLSYGYFGIFLEIKSWSFNPIRKLHNICNIYIYIYIYICICISKEKLFLQLKKGPLSATMKQGLMQISQERQEAEK